MPVIDIAIKNKIATSPSDIIVCKNKDYKVRFTFDAEWDGYLVKTARFIWNGQKQDVVFEGDTCDCPEIVGAKQVEVGVFAGDLHTTTPAFICCRPSILCKEGAPAAPSVDVYNQIIDICSKTKEIAEKTMVTYIKGTEDEPAVLYELETGSYFIDGYVIPHRDYETPLVPAGLVNIRVVYVDGSRFVIASFNMAIDNDGELSEAYITLSIQEDRLHVGTQFPYMKVFDILFDENKGNLDVRVSALERHMADIETGLDAIIEIQQNLIGGA